MEWWEMKRIPNLKELHAFFLKEERVSPDHFEIVFE
jgi:hypothetical protein